MQLKRKNNKILIICALVLHNYSVIQQFHRIGLDFLDDFAIAGEGAGAFDVAGEGGDDVGVKDVLVKIADERLAGHVAGGDVADGLLGLLACEGIDDGRHPVYPDDIP